MRIFVFDRNDEDCLSAVRKLSSQALKPNMFIPVTEAEFAALRDSMMSIEVDDPPKSLPPDVYHGKDRDVPLKSPTPPGEAGNEQEQNRTTPFD